MNPFNFRRVSESDSGNLRHRGPGYAKFLAGGTNLIDLMKNGVERPERLVDINRLPLAKSKPFPTEGCVSARWRVTVIPPTIHLYANNIPCFRAQFFPALRRSSGTWPRMAAICCSAHVAGTSWMPAFRNAISVLPEVDAALWKD